MATLQDLLLSPWQELDKLSDEDLHKICFPFFKVTRPTPKPKISAAGGLIVAQALAEAKKKGLMKPTVDNKPDPTFNNRRFKQQELMEKANAKLKAMGLDTI